MKKRLGLVLLAVGVMSGCVARATLYPVQGPLASQTPVPVASARLSGAFNSGSIKVTLSDGEVFQGRWSVAPRPGGPGATMPNNDMASVWDTVYGQGFYTAHVLGQKLYVQTTLTGSKGTTLKVEMYRSYGREANESAPASIRGVAKDSAGNIYKVTF